MQPTETRSAHQLPRDLADWAEKFRSTSDGDKELQAHGKFYTCTFLLDLDEHTVLVKMVDGKVHDLLIDPGPLDEGYQFAIRASADTWRNFATPTPKPMYHGIWAATFRKGMTLEGDLLVLMQNLREITRHLELLRTTGVPLSQSRRS